MFTHPTRNHKTDIPVEVIKAFYAKLSSELKKFQDERRVSSYAR